ncbi:hypothetical protein DPMN_176288 [Dreissena polymorpha]|uniref:Uncharacterized protein n=1 Tax=Dreissena polymorpha TaxID=45954 RepID=A0A9D4E6M4_DREPO|nr:hypothetical protein DPMN_176288 [Dreissena polymorpha]
MLFFAFPSHQRPGLWRSVRPRGVLITSLVTLPRSYCVLTATKADHSRSEDAIDVQRTTQCRNKVAVRSPCSQ